MIQRIQSLFLFLVDIVLVILLFVPYISSTQVEEIVSPAPVMYTLLDNPGLLVGQIVLCILAAVTMVMFKNRKLQMKLCLVGAILSLLFSGLLAYNIIFPMDSVIWKIEPGTYISLANAVLFLLARNFIMRDENMVQSADRIR